MNLTSDFSYIDIPLKSYDGNIKATFIASKFNTEKRKSVLYIHGVVDYFFHPHVAEQFHNHGFDFYALDLRRHGRSLIQGQKANFCTSIDEYFEEISVAIDRITKITNEPFYLFGLSTGGLVATNYLFRGDKAHLISGLILNSPFFDFAHPQFLKKLILDIAKLGTKINPNFNIQIPWVIPFFKQIHKSYKGEWNFNLEMKPMKGFPTYFTWLLAIHKAQQQIRLERKKLDIPILILHSEKSNTGLFIKKEQLSTSDIVLNVEDMQKIGSQLGTNVTLIAVKDGMHDIFLSKKHAREFAFKHMFNWLESI